MRQAKTDRLTNKHADNRRTNRRKLSNRLPDCLSLCLSVCPFRFCFESIRSTGGKIYFLPEHPEVQMPKPTDSGTFPPFFATHQTQLFTSCLFHFLKDTKFCSCCPSAGTLAHDDAPGPVLCGPGHQRPAPQDIPANAALSRCHSQDTIQ